MAGGGVAFSQALENQGGMGTNSSEPVVKYGTGGRISGFANGGNVDSQGVRHFMMGGDEGLYSIAQDGGGGGGGGGGFDWYDGGSFGGFNYGGAGGDGGARDLGINPNTGAVKMEFTGMAPPDYAPAAGDLDYGPAATPIDSPFDGDSPFDSDSPFDGGSPFGPPIGEVPDLGELIIPAPRPTIEPFTGPIDPIGPFDPFSILEPVDPYVAPYVEPFVDELIIPAPRPKDPYVAPFVEITPFVEPYVAPFVEDPYVDPYVAPFVEDPYVAPYVAPFVEDPYVEPFVEDPYVEPFVEDPYIAPYVPPVDPYAPPFVAEPFVPPVAPYVPPVVPPAARSIYRPQYQNYADPLTMFNVSNYGRDLPTSAGYNYALQNQGIAAMNQHLRDVADIQMAQTYPDGSPKGADMNQVLADMRKYGLTPADLENARYNRTSGLNTPFSQYKKEAPTERTFGGGIAELIKNLPK